MLTPDELVNTVLPPPPLLSIVPPLQVNVPVKMAVLVPSNVPPNASSNAGLICTSPATFSAPPLTRCNPAPVKLLPSRSVIVPPPKFKTQVALAFNVPLLEPPPSKLNTPFWQVTMLPLFRNVTRDAAPLPLDFLSVPSLLKIR